MRIISLSRVPETSLAVPLILAIGPTGGGLNPSAAARSRVAAAAKESRVSRTSVRVSSGSSSHSRGQVNSRSSPY